MEKEITQEEFWKILWGEEAFPLSRWYGEECPITRSRFNEALERLNEFLENRGEE